ncbi:hypothetical protein FH972_024656 [Carpinus fangiana]|uniref:Large ribosomal subunit protein mL67 n=1 Tax=Carpinus fangiana TaxID=176857 RepID=A0A5N6L162_9ROSI|nr:hypothetical protein FH972_024656 [Carpinus fangiana]
MAAEAAPAAKKLASSLVQASQIPEHGQHIFVYGHFRTNQVIYSLNRTMRNNRALKQLPYLGKKSKPPTLRRDHWRPLATLTFPSGRQGLNAYKELREFRMRHEHEWDFPDLVRAPKAKVARRLQDQKANSIADMAYVLLRQDRVARYQSQHDETEQLKNEAAEEKAKARVAELRKLKEEAQKDTTPEGITKFKALKAEKQHLVRNLGKPVEHRSVAGLWSPINDKRPKAKRGVGRLRGLRGAPRMTMEGVRIEWANILDAEFAANWPQSVIHDTITRGGPRTRNIHSTSHDVLQAPTELEGRIGKLGAKRAERTETVIQSPNSSEERSGLNKLLDRLRNGRQDAMSV